MSDLLAIGFDCISSPNIKLNLEGGSPQNSGWGFGWYPDDDSAASVVKDTGVKKAEDITSALSDWRRFRSTNFLWKVKGAAKKPSQQDTQPFQRSFWGRDWLFLHNGDLDKQKLKDRIGETDGFLKPNGSTDSELAFCFLLQQFQLAGSRRIADVGSQNLMNWLSALDQFGAVDVVFSDGQSLVAYHGTGSNRDLHYSRQTPPDINEKQIGSDTVTLDFSDPLDIYRSAFLISSSILSGANWTKMQSGQLIVVRTAEVVFDSHNNNEFVYPNVTFAPYHQPQQQGVNTPFSNVQGEQAQQAPNGPVVTNTKSILKSDGGNPLRFRSFRVTHLTEYNYTHAVNRSTHILRLQPVEDKIQEVVRSTMDFSANGERLHFEDVFGNQSIHITVEEPYTSLRVQVESEIKIYASPNDDFSSSVRRTSIPLVWMPWQRQMMLPYLLPPELPEPQLLELTEYAMSFVERADYNLVETLSEINRQIFKDFSYVQGHTSFETTPFDVYTSRKGVCQDFANLFICLARLLNIPARYRVGYIHTGANYANKLQSEASHAWVEVYLPYLGWRGFDPTNGILVGQEHIRTACGRNYRDAAPTTGTLFKGGGGESLSVNVRVEEIGQG